MLIYLQTIGSDEDKDKFERLYRQYKGLMFHAVMEILRSREDAEDVVHQSFVKIIEKLDKIGQVDSPQTQSYILAVCRTVSLDLLRKRRREALFGEEELDEIDLPQSAGGGRLSDAFRRLRPQYRELLLLRYHLGYKTSEIARQLHITNETVRKRLQYARNMLQDLLDEDDANA